MEQKVFQEMLHLLEYKGILYHKRKTRNMFHSKLAKENAQRFRTECDRRLANMFRGLGVTSIDDIIRQTEENVRLSKTCKKCGLFCRDYHKLEQHLNSQKCKQLQAEQKGEKFIPKRETRKQCDICNKSILFYNWTRHLEGVLHTENVRKMTEPAFQCTVCEKTFKGARPKQMLKRHLNSKKHLENVKQPWNKFKHNQLIKKHFSKVLVV